jgi:hypothetical protein
MFVVYRISQGTLTKGEGSEWNSFCKKKYVLSVLKQVIWISQYKEDNRTVPSPSVRIPQISPICHYNA